MNKNVPTEMVNRTILEALANDNVKTAADAATDYTRIQLREDSFAFKILPPEQITPDNLDRDIDERNRVICELEPDSPGSKWCPLQDVPEGEYIVGSRYVIPFALVLTRKYTKTIQELSKERALTAFVDGDRGGDLILVGQLGGGERRLAAAVRDLGREPRAVVGGPRRHEDPRAFLGEPPGASRGDARGPCDEDDALAEAPHGGCAIAEGGRSRRPGGARHECAATLLARGFGIGNRQVELRLLRRVQVELRLGLGDDVLVNVGGAVRAVQGICSHEYFELDRGFLTAGSLTCALHMSRFDLVSGEPLDPPADEPSSHPALNPGLLNGPRSPQMGANVGRNSEEERILAALVVGAAVGIGGGFGGATVAKYLRMWSTGLDVTLVERNAEFISCPLSNRILAGTTTLAGATSAAGFATGAWPRS